MIAAACRGLLFALSLSQGPEKRALQAPKQDTASARDLRGTAQSPAVFEIVRTPHDSEETERQRKHEADHALYEAMIGWSTFGLAVLTFCLALATAILARFTWRLWKTTHDMMDKSDLSAKAMADQAEITADLMAKSASAMAASADAAESMFYATHPPQIVVENVRFLNDAGDIGYSIENNGGSDAQILDSNISRRLHVVGETLPRPLPFNEACNNVLGETSLDLGVRIDHTDLRDPDNYEVAIVAVEPGARMALFGFIVYQGRNGKRHRTEFYRVSDPATGFFDILDPYYERTH